MNTRPITERVNKLTSELDVAEPTEFLRLLSLSDEQLFTGYGEAEDAADFVKLPDVCESVAHVAAVIQHARTAHGAGVRVVLGGAGTSGRLAWLCARDANAALALRKLPCFVRYAIAGGDAALLTSQESAEDSPALARADLARASAGATALVYIGITCGLSAPYVLAQLDAALHSPAIVAAVLVGFSPLRLARKLPIEGWTTAAAGDVQQCSFYSVVSALVQQFGGLVHVITPVVGPESVAGSTRMKGGSATKILLDALLSLAVADGQCNAAAARAKLLSAQPALNAVYNAPATATKALARAVELCADALRRGGSVLYVGGPVLGPFAVIDASECVPTFGAAPEDVRAFVEDGWNALCATEGDLSARGGSYVLAADTFFSIIAPATRPQDVVIVIGDGAEDAKRLAALVRSRIGKATRLCVFAFCCDGNATPPISILEDAVDAWGMVTLPARDNEDPLNRTAQHLATKLVLNALTTGAFTATGKVFGNRMVDLRVSNAKLYHRACDLVASLTGVSADAAERCVLRAIHGEQGPEAIEKLRIAPPSDHVRAAYQQPKIVPIALLLASGAVSTVADACSLLTRQPVVRIAIATALKQSHH